MIVTNNRGSVRYLFYRVAGIPKVVRFRPFETIDIQDLTSEDQINYNPHDAALKLVNDRFGRGFVLDFSTLEESIAISYFLDTYSGATVAYSLRQLSPEAEYAVRVRESGGNTELDIPFDDSGLLDEDALLAHCGANSGFVTKWYDQSGNGNDLVQTTNSRQPQIVSSGATIELYGRPALSFDGTDDYMTLTSAIAPSVPWTSFQVGQKFSQTSLGMVLSSSVADAPFTAMDYTDGFYYLRSSTGTFVSGAGDSNASRKAIAGVYTGTTGGGVWKGRATVTGNTFGTVGVGNFIDFGRRESAFSKGHSQEFFLYKSDQSANARAINANMLYGANTVVSLPSTATPGYLIGLAGQSNGTDRFVISGNLPAGLQGVQQDAWTHFKTIDDTSDNGFWTLMEPGVNTTTTGGITGSFSVAVSLANRLKNYGKAAYVVPTAVGGTALDSSVVPSWHPTHTGEYYDRLVTNFMQAYNQASQVSDLEPVLLWIQGEYDAGTQALADNYEDNLTDLITQFRADTGFPNLKVVVTQLRSDTTYTYRETVRTAQANVATNMTNVYLFDTSPYPISADGEHYNPIVASFGGVQSAILMGEGIAELIKTF